MKNLLLFGVVSGFMAAGASAQAAPPQTCTSAPLKLDTQVLGVLAHSLRFQSKEIARLSRGRRDILVNDRDAKGRVIERRSRRAGDAEGTTGKPWALKDLAQDQTPGTSTARAYAELGLADGTQTLVAVIDSGMDIEHEDLKANVWTNPLNDATWPGDAHGWNFLGAKDGRSVDWTNLEVTRELRKMKKLEAQGPLSANQQAYLADLQASYDKGVQESKDRVELRKKQLAELEAAIETLKQACGVTGDRLAEVQAVESTDPVILAAKAKALSYLSAARDYAWFKASIDHWAMTLNFYYNLENDPGAIVGDDPEKLDETGYGNPNVLPVNAEEAHATHVAGIIGAVRGNGLGIDGQAANVRIMSLRAVPNGDERDKDVANAIRFAVDHGARVINMSFGKAFSPQKEYVWSALGYAEDKGVLVVHAAGNDAQDNDVSNHYPDRRVRDAQGAVTHVFTNVLEVGASTRFADAKLPAEFSDYGQTSVDLFAPGAAILSTVPESKYAEFDGTSMATPEVAGIAALILSQRPDLRAADLRALLMGTVTRFEALSVNLPGSTPDAPAVVPFTRLSITGGVVNTLEALKVALGLK